MKKSLLEFVSILHSLLPLPVSEEQSDDGVILTAGDPGLVVVDVSNRGLVISIFGVRWDGPHTPIRHDRELCSLSWQELPNDLPQQAIIVQALIQAAVAIRRCTFHICSYCKQPTPPEWQHNHNVCRGCAEKHLGVVH